MRVRRSALACAAWAASPPETRAVARRKSALTLVRGRVRVKGER